VEKYNEPLEELALLPEEILISPDDAFFAEWAAVDRLMLPAVAVPVPARIRISEPCSPEPPISTISPALPFSLCPLERTIPPETLSWAGPETSLTVPDEEPDEVPMLISPPEPEKSETTPSFALP
jgi:hypothetical protein